MFEKGFIALFVVLLCAGNSGVSQISKLSMTLVSSWDNRFTNSLAKSCPVSDTEEQTGKDAPSSESTEDDEYLTFKWASIRLSCGADISEQNGSADFQRIDLEILVPPPRA